MHCIVCYGCFNNNFPQIRVSNPLIAVSHCGATAGGYSVRVAGGCSGVPGCCVECSAEPLVSSPWWKLETQSLLLVKGQAAAAMGQVNLVARERQGAEATQWRIESVFKHRRLS